MASNLSPKKAYEQVLSFFGEDSVFLNPRDVPPVQVTRTGSPGLDRALGVGGWPLGRIMQIAGTPSAGKTQLTLIAGAEWQKRDPENSICFIDAEYTYDPDWAESLGIDNDRVLLIKTNSALRIFEGLVGKKKKTSSGKIKVNPGLLGLIEEGVTIKGETPDGGSKEFDLSKMGVIIIDSIASMETPIEEVSEVGKQNVSTMARFMTTELRKLTPAVAKANVALFGINHVKTKIGVMFGDPKTTPGGRAWHHACSVQVMLASIESKDSRIEDENQERIGHMVRAKVTKNKVATPHKKAEYSMEYVRGIVQKELELFEAGKAEGLIERPNNVMYEYNGESFRGQDAMVQYISENLESFEEALREKYLDRYSGPPEDVEEEAEEIEEASELF